MKTGGGVWLAGFFVASALGQGFGVGAGGARLPPVGPIPPLAPFQSHAPIIDQRRIPHRPGFRRPVFLPYAFPALVGGYAYEYSPPAQNVIVVQQPVSTVTGEEATVPQRPPIHSEIREYAHATAGEAVSAGEQRDFVIAFNDGTVHSAVAVWTEDGILHYVGADGGHWSIPLAGVNRKLTARLNRERNLRLQLPAPPGQ